MPLNALQCILQILYGHSFFPNFSFKSIYVSCIPCCRSYHHHFISEQQKRSVGIFVYTHNKQYLHTYTTLREHRFKILCTDSSKIWHMPSHSFNIFSFPVNSIPLKNKKGCFFVLVSGRKQFKYHSTFP